jgi:hypothetical protein
VALPLFEQGESEEFGAALLEFPFYNSRVCHMS